MCVLLHNFAKPDVLIQQHTVDSAFMFYKFCLKSRRDLMELYRRVYFIFFLVHRAWTFIFLPNH